MTIRNTLTWTSLPAHQPKENLLQTVGGHPLVAQILAQRGYSTPESARAFLFPEYYSPAPPDALPDLLTAGEIIHSSIINNDTMLVWGDFDVDGQTSTSLLVSALRGLGAAVEFYIPGRLRESHGVPLDSLREQLLTRRAGVLLTCDTGISAHESIDYAKSQGVITLVTDHHDLPPVLPAADAVINPKRLPADHPLATLPGVGVAYKLVEHLYTSRHRADELPQFLDLVALGIVADVAEQTRDTRYLLQIGLDRLRDTRRIGLQALIEIAGLPAERLSATDIGYQLGPRLNAAGRLDDARPAVELLTTDDPTRARLLALQLEGLNNQRRLLNRQIYAAAQEQIARDPSLLDWEALVLAHPAWHAGIIGVVASHLAEYYQRPVVLLSVSGDGTARGSARSAPGYDIGAAIAAQADLLLTYGGHPGAAGLSLPEDNIPAFRRRLSNTLQETRDPTARPGLNLDAYISLGEVTLDLAADLNRLAPFGEGNPRITLATRDLTLKSAAFVGRSHEHRRLIVEDASGNRQNVIWWNSADQPLPDGLFDLAYQLEINTYQDKTELQLVWIDYRRSESAPVEVAAPQRQVLDYRGSPYPAAVLRDIVNQHPDAVVWAEGYPHAESPGLPLSELSPSDMLVVYTTPTGPQALYNALERVKPIMIVLIATNPPAQAFADVLRRILGLVKYVLNQQRGQTTLSVLAEAAGQSITTVRLVLEYLSAKGEIHVEYPSGDSILITAACETPASDLMERLTALQSSAAETAAYRAFFQRATPQQIVGEIDMPPRSTARR
jgi:single-stranded-DNA-specific exonuclease